MGFHFMNPVPVMQLVELIRGIATDKETFEACRGVVDKLGKTAASAEDFPAFIVNRILMPMINEAVKILEENKAQRPSDIDVVWLNGYGWPADKGGPMFYGDMVGAQAVLDVMEKLGAEDPEFAPAELLRDLAKNGGKFTEIDTGGLKV